MTRFTLCLGNHTIEVECLVDSLPELYEHQAWPMDVYMRMRGQHNYSASVNKTSRTSSSKKEARSINTMVKSISFNQLIWRWYRFGSHWTWVNVWHKKITTSFVSIQWADLAWAASPKCQAVMSSGQRYTVRRWSPLAPGMTLARQPHTPQPFGLHMHPNKVLVNSIMISGSGFG